MREYLIVETRDAADHKDPQRMTELAVGISKTGAPVTIFLAENGVFAARKGLENPLDEALASGVRVAVDRFALDERGIKPGALRSGVAVEDIELIVDHAAAGACVMWR
ncbi:MAG: hypothetical protein ACREBK_07785 [Sphingomicrobium sp.]